MIGTDSDYEEAVRASQIHSYEKSAQKNSINKPLFSLATLVLLGFSAYYYQKSNLVEKPLNRLAKTDVLGVVYTPEETATKKTHVEKIAKVKQESIELPKSIQTKELIAVVDEVEPQKDDYMLALENMEVDVLSETYSKKEIQNKPAIELKDLSKEMKQLVEESNIDNSKYEQDIEEEIKSDSGTQNKIVVVQKGDTLVSIAERYYGDEAYYTKIIASNSHIFDNADLIYVGQKITLPY